MRRLAQTLIAGLMMLQAGKVTVTHYHLDINKTTVSTTGIKKPMMLEGIHWFRPLDRAYLLKLRLKGAIIDQTMVWLCWESNHNCAQLIEE